MEYGLFTGVTILLAPSAQIVTDDEGGVTRAAQGLADADLGVRLRLFAHKSQVFSIEPHVIVPGTATSEENALLASGKTDYELRALYGLSGRTLHKPFFIDAQAAYRRRSGPFADEWRADLSVGISPTRRWQIIAKTSSIVSRETFSLHKVGMSLVYVLTKRISLEAGTMRAIAGQQVVRESAYQAGVWLRF